MAKKEKSDKPKKQEWYNTYTHKDAKIHAIELGMPFPDVVNSDFWGLISYVETQHSLRNNQRNPELLVKFDDWMEQIMLQRGREDLIHDSLRLSYVTEEKREEDYKKPKEEKAKPQKREKTADGLVKGTKKAYTFELAQKGLSIEKITRRVLKRFPDASEKSILIWVRKARPSEKKEKIKKEKPKKTTKREKTVEELAAQKERNKQRRKERQEGRRKANEERLAKVAEQKKRKRNKKKRK